MKSARSLPVSEPPHGAAWSMQNHDREKSGGVGVQSVSSRARIATTWDRYAGSAARLSSSKGSAVKS